MIPSWFEDNFVDIEQLLIDLFKKVFPEIPEDRVGVWTPDDWLDDDLSPLEVLPLLTFVRLPGGVVDWEQNYDECLVQASIVTGSRATSIQVMSVIRACLLPMSGFKFTMDDGLTAQIHKCSEISGPQLLSPGQEIDTRVVPATFRVRVGLRSRKRYEADLSAL